MKKLTLSEVLDAFEDNPISIGDRLVLLGFEKEDALKLFSKELLETQVYGSSFLVFLRENSSKLPHERGIPAEPIPENFENAFDEEPKSVGTRLIQSGFTKDDIASLFTDDILNLVVNADEFTKFISDNKDRIIPKMNELLEKEGTQSASA